MKTKLVPVLLVLSSALALGARAQVAVPTPAPVVDGVNPAVNAMPAPAPSRVIYSPRLPSPTELSNVAAAQGLGIERIDQTAEQITVVYKKANGQLTTVAYQLLGTNAQVAPATTTVVTTPAPTVVYQAREPFYYYDEPYYNPWAYGYYSPVSVNLGFGFYHGFGGYRGGYRGGFHGHRRW